MGFFGPDTSSARNPVSLASLVNAVRRNVRTVGLFGLGGLTLGLAATAALSPTWRSSSVVEVRRLPSDDVNPASAQVTEAELARSIPVAERAIAALGLTVSPDDLIDRYTTFVVTDHVIRFDVQAGSSDEAVDLADELAASFLAERASGIESETAIVVDTLQGRIDQIDAELAELDPQIQDLSAEVGNDINVSVSRQIDELSNRRNGLAGERTDLIGRIFEAQLEADVALDGSRLIAPGRPPKRPIFPSLQFDLPVALILGLIAGLGYVIVREVVSNKIRYRQEVATAAVAPVTIELPWRIEARNRFGRRRSIPRRWAASDRIRTSGELHWLLRSAPSGTAGHLVFASSGADLSTAALVGMFADELATRGDVVVIDVFSGDADVLADAFRDGVPSTVQLRTVGNHVPPVPPRTTARLVFLTTRTRLDWPVLSGSIGSSVLVVGSGRVSAQQVRSSSHELYALGMPVVTCALVDPDRRDDSSGYPTLPAEPVGSA